MWHKYLTPALNKAKAEKEWRDNISRPFLVSKEVFYIFYMGLLADKKWPRDIVIFSQLMTYSEPVCTSGSSSVLFSELVYYDRGRRSTEWCMQGTSGASRPVFAPVPPPTILQSDHIWYISPPPKKSTHSMPKGFAQETACLICKYIRVQVLKLNCNFPAPC